MPLVGDAESFAGRGKGLTRSREAGGDEVDGPFSGFRFRLLVGFRPVLFVPFMMTGLAEPPHIKWTIIIIVVGLHQRTPIFEASRCAASFALIASENQPLE